MSLEGEELREQFLGVAVESSFFLGLDLGSDAAEDAGGVESVFGGSVVGLDDLGQFVLEEGEPAGDI